MSLVHIITGEQSRLRRWSLYFFARYLEMPLLAWGYHLLRGRYRRLGALRPVRAALGWGLAAPLAYLGDTARPLPAAAVQRLIDELEGPLAVGPCRCRTAHGSCDHPLETDIVIRTGVEAWRQAFPDEYRLIGKEEAKQIVAECSRLGMWHMVFVHCPVEAHRHEHQQGHAHALSHLSPPDHPPLPGGRGVESNEYVICNCCACGCVPYILNRELGQQIYPLLRGAYVAETDPAQCVGHGACVAACPFGVRVVEGGKARLVEACFGCGLCAGVCPEGAIQMRPSLLNLQSDE